MAPVTSQANCDVSNSNSSSLLVDEHPEPLKIAIVGAGIGGLSAAIALRRQGHQVTLYEKSGFAGKLGAAIHLTPNCNGILRRWGIFAENFGANPSDGTVRYSSEGKLELNIDLTEANKRWQHPWMFCHRVRLHDALLRMTTSAEGEGPPARLYTSSQVVDVDPEKGTVTLADGTETDPANLIIGADGTNSITRKHIKQDLQLVSSGKAAFRFFLPREVAEADPVTAPLVQRKNSLSLWLGTTKRIVMYPYNDNSMLNFVCTYPDTESHSSEQYGEEALWNKKGKLDQLLAVYQDFDPAVKALLGKADPAQIKVWPLLDMDKPPTWSAGRLVLLGDAVHPFTPYQAQGAGQAMEDAAALAVVLPRGTDPKDLRQRLELYEEIRYERAHTIQKHSIMVGKDLVNGKQMVTVESAIDYDFGHDAYDYATKVFNRWKWAQKPDLCWRMPIAFGPSPGPRQDAYGRRRLADGPTREFTTATIKFQTSRTFLDNLLPTSQFRFAEPATVATASFSATRFDKMAWLGGEGYTHLGLYVHGVQYVKQDGTVVDGDYLPVLFESLADSIISDREELGMPKLFCDIALHEREHSCRVTASWRGATFATLTLPCLQADDPVTEQGTIGSEADPGLLVYRYIPAVGEPGVADAAYACIMSHQDKFRVQPPTVEAVSRCRLPAPSNDLGLNGKSGKGPEINVDPLDWDALPTLHHITSALAQMPVYDVISAKVVKGTGVPDANSAKRIE